MTVLKTCSIALTAAVLALSTQAATAQQPAFASVLKEGHGVSLDIGLKRTMVYFLSRDGQCKATFSTSDARYSAKDWNPTRVNVDIAPGKSFKMADGYGYAVAFKCSATAKTIELRPVLNVAYKAN
ncbi:MAG: hypothetical protein AAFV45_05045 [Pseudomonadota bacterium]